MVHRMRGGRAAASGAGDQRRGGFSGARSAAPPERTGISNRAPHGVPMAGDDCRARADILALAGSSLAISEPLGRPGGALVVGREGEHWRCLLATKRVAPKRLRMKMCADSPR